MVKCFKRSRLVDQVLNHWGLVAEACKVAVKARNLGWMYTIWVLHGPPWEVAGNHSPTDASGYKPWPSIRWRDVKKP